VAHRLFCEGACALLAGERRLPAVGSISLREQQRRRIPRLDDAVRDPGTQGAVKGGGHASQTDLFVLARTRSGDLVTIAVEGKVDEKFDELVRDWLAAPQRDGTPGPTAGRKARLSYLCALLEIDEDKASELRYQLLHRTAAALIEADRFNARHALMLVHSFSRTSAWLDDYRAFARELGVEAGADEIVRVGARGGVELSVGWVRGEAAFLEA
jgi:hypothetical protein